MTACAAAELGMESPTRHVVSAPVIAAVAVAAAAAVATVAAACSGGPLNSCCS